MAFKNLSTTGIFLVLFLLIIESSQQAQLRTDDDRIKTEVFLSPKIALQPGLVSDKYYNNIDFPRGHIALKSFNGEVVDENGTPIPLHETYLHHWVVLRYYQRKDVSDNIDTKSNSLGGIFASSDHIKVKNSGVCDSTLSQYYGLGSETRGTATDIPDPYGIEVGNEADIPEGYEEVWMLNVHAIDTRGAEDKMGCTECRCDMYNVTKVGNYKGGLRCCSDDFRCTVKEEFQGVERRNLYLRYTVKYVDWSDSIVPLKIYILDVTDLWTKGDDSRGIKARHHCLVEYDLESCPNDKDTDQCTHTKTLKVSLPIKGDVIYGVGHQHAGGTGTALYGEGGREICSSYPIYGKGYEAGDEAGYIVGMTTCYPSPGSIKMFPGEKLTFVSNYSSTTKHTGVMGLFYLLVAEESANPSNSFQHLSSEVYDVTRKMNVSWAVVVFGLVVLFGVAFFVLRAKRERPEGYEPVV